jgi:uncharacterized protein with HEPN domain
MQPNALLKYLLDIESVIGELDEILKIHDRDFKQFKENFMAVRATERDLMIIGEAIGKILKIEPKIQISSARHIVGLRNMIVHAYDAIDPTTLWKILIKDIPLLKTEIEKIKN